MKNRRIFCTFFISLAFCITVVKAADFTQQHAYVLNSSSSKSKGYFLEFFNNGDSVKSAIAFSFLDTDLRYDKAKVINQLPGAYSLGVVIRPLWTGIYINSEGETNNPNIVQMPGFWAFNLDNNKIVRIADAMYTFSNDGNYSKCNMLNTNYDVAIGFLNKDDTGNFFAFKTWKLKKGESTKISFNYDGGIYSTSDLKIVALYVQDKDNAIVKQLSWPNVIRPGVYSIGCIGGTTFDIKKEQEFLW